jgi:alpha-L-fucosidase 2
VVLHTVGSLCIYLFLSYYPSYNNRDLFCSHPVRACVQHLGSTSTMPAITYTFVGYPSLPLVTSTCYDNNTLQVQGSAGTPGMIWEILATVQATGNGADVSCSAINSTTSVITVGGAKGAWITWVGDTNYDMNAGNAANQFSFRGPDPHDTLTSLIQSSSNKDYLDLFNEHVQDYSSIMSSFSLDLGQQANLDASTDNIVRAYRRDVGDPYLEWILFNYGRYLLTGSSRGTLPANLQGRWVVDNSPWSADYREIPFFSLFVVRVLTFTDANINVQMNYWFAELTNMNVTQPLWDYMEVGLGLLY